MGGRDRAGLHPVARLVLAVNRLWPPPKYYDPAGTTQLAWRHAASAPFLDHLQQFATLQGATVMDLGCGAGGFAVALAERGAHLVLGCDFGVPDMVLASRHVSASGQRVAFFAQDAARMGLPDRSVDAIITIATFEHMPDPAAALAESHRVLKPGGIFFASFEPYYGPGGGHVFDFIGLPWAHLLYPERHLLAAWRHLSAGNPALARANFTMVETESGMARRLLNGITARRFEAMVAATPFERLYWRQRCVKDIDTTWLVGLIPTPLREMLTMNVTAVLRRRAEA